MEYSKLTSITGLSGLYELMASKADGAIVRSLDNKSTKFISSRMHNFSNLESIEVYTQRDNVNLVDIFKAMESSSEPLPSENDTTAIKAYFEKVYPELDFERVYASDMKKMIRWFDIIKKNEIEIRLRDKGVETAAEETKEEVTAAPVPKNSMPVKNMQVKRQIKKHQDK